MKIPTIIKTEVTKKLNLDLKSSQIFKYTDPGIYNANIYNNEQLHLLKYYKINILDIIQWGNVITNWTDAFSNCEFLEHISANDIPILLHSTYNMFAGCKNLKSINNIENWNLSKVRFTWYMFANCFNFNANLSKWNTRYINNSIAMFVNCYSFNSDLSKWNTLNLINTDSMFYNCYDFNSDLSNWNVKNIKYAEYMFYECKSFNSDLSRWNLSNLKNGNFMFKGCLNFNRDLSNWKLDNLEKYQIFDYSYLDFNNKPKIITLFKL